MKFCLFIWKALLKMYETLSVYWYHCKLSLMFSENLAFNLHVVAEIDRWSVGIPDQRRGLKRRQIGWDFQQWGGPPSSPSSWIGLTPSILSPCHQHTPWGRHCYRCSWCSYWLDAGFKSAIGGYVCQPSWGKRRRYRVLGSPEVTMHIKIYWFLFWSVCPTSIFLSCH